MCEKLPFTHTLRALQRLYLEMLVTLLLELIFRSFLSNAKFCLDHKSPSAELFELRQVLILIAELEVSRASPEACNRLLQSQGLGFLLLRLKTQLARNHSREHLLFLKRRRPSVDIAMTKWLWL
uniref:Uncharacterized protein n=1 Tax=Physcomitrium patens TaxID=3218 RepID=A0A2K1JIF7_PHYPA|nr:hypothetical protein PHYPA_018741 [Physcomitrium patens]